MCVCRMDLITLQIQPNQTVGLHNRTRRGEELLIFKVIS